MVPNGSAYSNYPSFANNGTKTPPGGSTESAKYALGMVPADTFPAEWANYLFHGATAGITRLNADTGSIKKEINTVLSNFNITPDATLNNQLMEALTKLKAEAALAAHPVGSLYWTSVNENPAVTFGGGTWVQIKDKFILSAGDTYSNGATGGAATVTLTTDQMPSHSHNGSTGTESNGHYHEGETGINNRGHTHNIQHDHYLNGNTTVPVYSLGTSAINGIQSSLGSGLIEYKYFPATGFTNGALYKTTDHTQTLTNAGDESVNHIHAFTTNYNNTNHTHGITSEGGGQAHNNMPPYIGKYCWERTA